MYGLRFFGFFTVTTFFFLNSVSFREFVQIHLDKILKFCVIVFSVWILYDAYLVYIVRDITLQLMYDSESVNYVKRPFGPTGQPSVNSVLICFLLSFLRNLGKQVLILDIVALAAVVLQASGSGAVAMLMYLIFTIKGSNLIVSISVSSLALFIVVSFGFNFSDLELDILGKISSDYISAMIGVFKIQVSNWLSLISFSTEVILFGGAPSEIDFGPLYFLSSTGLIYSIVYSGFLMFVLYNCRYKKRRQPLYILIVGNLHYPVMFYAVSTIILSIYYVVVLDELER